MVPACSSQSAFFDHHPTIHLRSSACRGKAAGTGVGFPYLSPSSSRPEIELVAVPVLFQTKKGGIHCHCLLSAVFRRHVQTCSALFVRILVPDRIFPVNLMGSAATVVPFRFVPPRPSRFCFWATSVAFAFS